MASPRGRQLVVLQSVGWQCDKGLWEETEQLVCSCLHPLPTQGHGQGTSHKEVRAAHNVSRELGQREKRERDVGVCCTYLPR